MSKWDISYNDSFYRTIVSYWVHVGVDEDKCSYYSCKKFEPPFPAKVFGKGFPYLTIKTEGTSFVFASLAELDHCIDVLSQKNMPTTRMLSEKRDENSGPNKHWLSRFPAKYKSWNKREKLVKAFQKSKKEIVKSGISF